MTGIETKPAAKGTKQETVEMGQARRRTNSLLPTGPPPIADELLTVVSSSISFEHAQVSTRRVIRGSFDRREPPSSESDAAAEGDCSGRYRGAGSSGHEVTIHRDCRLKFSRQVMILRRT